MQGVCYILLFYIAYEDTTQKQLIIIIVIIMITLQALVLPSCLVSACNHIGVVLEQEAPP